MSTTALTIITDAFAILNIVQAGEPVNADDAQTGFRALNRLIGSWAIQPRTIPSTVREVFPIVAGKGSPANPYTIGPTGDLVTARPPTRGSLSSAGLLMTNSTPPIEIPRDLMTDQAYEAIGVKDLTSSLFTGVFYRPTFTAGNGTLFLFPVPDGSQPTSLVLYQSLALTTFTSLTASYDLPTGYDEALTYNLARRLAGIFGRTMNPDDLLTAAESLAVVKRSTVMMTDLSNDFSLQNLRTGYDINTGTGGGA